MVASQKVVAGLLERLGQMPPVLEKVPAMERHRGREATACAGRNGGVREWR
jgi:hypothetical protein